MIGHSIVINSVFWPKTSNFKRAPLFEGCWMRTYKQYGQKDDKNTMRSMHVQRNVPLLMKYWPQLAIYSQKFSFLASDKQMEQPPPVFSGCSMQNCKYYGH